MVSPEEVLEFWLDEVGPAKWYIQETALDDAIRSRFLPAWEDAQQGKFSLWLTCPDGALAYIILTDQFPRNMFRGDPRSFASDRAAITAAKAAIAKGWDMKIDEPARQFFYLPLMHSECITDQDRCVRLMLERMPSSGEGNLTHARAHREVIRRFGRFPYRNDVLGRGVTRDEQSFLDAGGYGATLRDLQDASSG
ncbi:DUF924 family protein [Pseudodonghicola xiamenensis]|uniref:DUF924 domain-containing protein n=1 Tax=Pseudodonghicola xiamenensis TaxID=337702 RepID=A0A8J3H4Z8_9RHOB|nr:DUF924 family protein [Pseudodonghicola xiamenensis]GHG87463.1 hypothetical protein GCM10010961_15920 [Pseudodonghicola xiamenensis]